MFRSRNPWLSGTLRWTCLLCAILFLLTSLPLLLFLGEAERYLSHLSYFVILGVVIMANSLNLKWIPYCLIGYGLLYFLVEVAFYGIPERPAPRKTVVFPKKAKFSDKSRHHPFHALSMWRALLETKAKVLYPFHVKKEVKGVVNHAIAPNIPHQFGSSRRDGCGTWHQYAGLRQKRTFEKTSQLRIGKTGMNSIWAVNFIPSSQEKILKLYSNLSKDLVGYGFCRLVKCASLLLLRF